MRRAPFTLIFVVCLRGLASQVVFVNASAKLVGVSPLDFDSWAVMDSLCVVRGVKEIACGHVVQLAKRGAIAWLGVMKETPQYGDAVKPSPLGPGVVKPNLREIAGTPQALSQLEDQFRPQVRDLRFSLGLALANPFVHFERLALDRLAFGVGIITMDTGLYGITETGFGFQISFTYYPSARFRGVFVQFAPTFFFSRVNVGGASQSVSEVGLQATYGWRWLWGDLNLGAALGAQYFHSLKGDPFPDGRQFVLPLLFVDIGLLM